jgi:thiopurine S-methyltransferase
MTFSDFPENYCYYQSQKNEIMELSYWISRWNKEKTGFHMQNGYPGLEKYWPAIDIPSGSTVMVPLCGKSLDMMWLSKKVDLVIGVEISQKAVGQFFKDNQLDVKRYKYAGFNVYRSGNIEIWCGDFIKLPENKIPDISLIYDKASLTALPQSMRRKYADKMKSFIQNDTKLLLHLFDYPQEEMNGPPFSITPGEVQNLYSEKLRVTLLEKNQLSLNDYQKFMKRGLKTYLIEYLLLLYNNQDKINQN